MLGHSNIFEYILLVVTQAAVMEPIVVNSETESDPGSGVEGSTSSDSGSEPVSSDSAAESTDSEQEDDMPLAQLRVRLIQRRGRQVRTLDRVRKRVRDLKDEHHELSLICDPIRQQIELHGYTMRRKRQLEVERLIRAAIRELKTAKRMLRA